VGVATRTGAATVDRRKADIQGMKISFAELAMAIAIAVIASTGPAHAGKVINYPELVDPSNYPAHVHAIHLANGTVLDATHSITFSDWTIGFGSQAPVATYTNTGTPQVAIRGLICTNADLGNNPCGVSISKQACFETMEPSTVATEIKCPESVEFTP
jgi:hypothetical protein